VGSLRVLGSCCQLGPKVNMFIRISQKQIQEISRIQHRGLTSEQHPFLVLDRFYHHAKILHCEWRGLISCSFIENLLTETRKLVQGPHMVEYPLTHISSGRDEEGSMGSSHHHRLRRRSSLLVFPSCSFNSFLSLSSQLGIGQCVQGQQRARS